MEKRLLRNGLELRISIATFEGDVKAKLAIGEYQKELLKNEVKEAKLV